jgi:hypothetical protein
MKDQKEILMKVDTTPRTPYKRTVVFLTPRQVDRLKAHQLEGGAPMAATIRRALDMFFDQLDELQGRVSSIYKHEPRAKRKGKVA